MNQIRSWKGLVFLAGILFCASQIAVADGKGRGGGGGGGGGGKGGGGGGRGMSSGGGGGRSSGGGMSGRSLSGGGSSRSLGGSGSGGSDRSSGASYFQAKPSGGGGGSSGSLGGTDSKRGQGSTTIRSVDAFRGTEGIKSGKGPEMSGKKLHGTDGSFSPSGNTVRSGQPSSSTNAAGSAANSSSKKLRDISGPGGSLPSSSVHSSNAAGTTFFDKHGKGKGNGKDNAGGNNSLATTGSGTNTALSTTADTSGKGREARSHSSSLLPPRHLSEYEETHRVGADSFLHDHQSDTFLHKHSSTKLHDHDTGELFKVRSDGDSLKSLGRHGGFGGGHHGGHHGHHDSSFFLAVGAPFFSFGYYNGYYPNWYWPGPYYGYGYGYPYGGLSVGVGSGYFGLSVGAAYVDPWPYYYYNPACVVYSTPPTYIVEEPGYAAAPPPPRALSEPVIADDTGPLLAPANPPTPNPATTTRQPTSATTPPAMPEPDPAAQSRAADFARQGEAAFKGRDYKEAVRHWRHALLDDPSSGTLVLMLAQAHFAVGEYAQGAGAVQMGMRMLPKEKWGVVVSNFRDLYSNTQDYVDQVKELEKAVKDKSKDPALRFLVGYHYLYLNYPAEALREFKSLDEEAKNDQAMKELVKVAEEELKKKAGGSDSPPAAEVPKKPDGQ